MKSLQLTYTIISFFILSSCLNYSVPKDLELSPQQVVTASAINDFSSVNRAVFQSRCIFCHAQYATYAGVVRELTAIQDAVNTNRMPQAGGPLTDRQKALLFSWIAKGAPEKEGDFANSFIPEILMPNWKLISENVIFPKCLACHNPQGQAKFLDLSNLRAIFENKDRPYANGVKLIDFDKPDTSYLLQILKDPDEPMPPIWSHIPRVSPSEIAIIQQWISLQIP